MLSSGLALSKIIMNSRICGWLDVVGLTQAQSNWSLDLAEVLGNWTLPLTEELMLNKSCWGKEDCIFWQAVANVKLFVFLWIPVTHMESTNWIMWDSKQITKEKKQEFWKDMLEQTWGRLDQHWFFFGGGLGYISWIHMWNFQK